MQKPLMKVEYHHAPPAGAPIHLTAFADTIVLNPVENKLIGIRFGGYAEMVDALSAVIHAGECITVQLGERVTVCMAEKKALRSSTAVSGSYKLCTMLPNPNQLEQEDNADGSVETAKTGRNVYLFCPVGDRAALFAELDRKTMIPMIAAFQDYLLDTLTAEKQLRQCQIHTLGEPFEAWELTCTADDRNIASILEAGLKTGTIQIPGTFSDGKAFEGVTGVSAYLRAFGRVIAGRIRERFCPLYDPAAEPLSESVRQVGESIFAQTGYRLYNAQLAAAEALKRELSRSKFAMLIAECGVGKSKIGLAALESYQREKGGKHFNLILCPTHITEKWVREIGETVPDALAAVVKTPADFDVLYSLCRRQNRTAYAVLSKERARDGYMRRPAVTWNRVKKAFVCPRCGKILWMKVNICGVPETVRADSLFFLTENVKNHKCPHCGDVLWTATSADEQSEWVRIGSYGYVHRAFAGEHRGRCRSPTANAQLEQLISDPKGVFLTKGAPKRVSLSEYIKEQYRGRIDGLLTDELHQYAANSGQGDAMGELYAVAKKCIGMTATLINGYSSGIFYLLYRTLAPFMEQDGQTFRDITGFNREYGVIESQFETIFEQYSVTKRTVHRKKRERLRPGVSPLVYSRFLLERAVCLSLFDMGKSLPEYEEIPVPLMPPNDVWTEYQKIEKTFQRIACGQKELAVKVQSAFLNLLIAYPDQPYGHGTIYNPLDGTPLYEPAEILPKSLNPKDIYLLSLVKEKVRKGERCIVYVNWTRLETRNKLKALLEENGAAAAILPETVQPSARERWIEQRLCDGLQVLIVNPACVETGLDLNAFTTLIFYDLGYKLFTFRQASRRSWRINQTAPRVEVYLLYFSNTVQERAVQLMASKLAVAGVIEGTNFSDEGLAAMGECQDLSTMLAKELTEGIRGEVVDVREAFRKMANLHVAAEKTAEEKQKTAAPAQKPKPVPLIWQPEIAEETEQLTLWELAG